MRTYDVGYYENLIAARLSPHRSQHSFAVARLAEQMARRFGADPARAYLSGILHDYAKGIPAPELMKLAEEKGLIEDPVERGNPDLLHAPVGAWLIEHELGISDPDILNAVRWHTVGAPGMSTLDKIIYLADVIEPGRDFPGVEQLRCLAERDLDRAMIAALDATLRYCIERGRLIHPRAVLLRNELLGFLRADKPV